MKSTSFFILALSLLAGSGAPAAIIQFTDRAAFLAALPPGYFSTDFSSLTAGDQTVTHVTLNGGSPSLNVIVASRNGADSAAGETLWLADTGNVVTGLGNSTTFSDQLAISAPSFTAIGGDWFLADIDDDYVAGGVTLTFSDSTVFNVASTSQPGSFRGYISDAPLSGLKVSAPDPNLTNGWVTIDNLVVSVPEPGSAVFLGLALTGMFLRRRR